MHAVHRLGGLTALACMGGALLLACLLMACAVPAFAEPPPSQVTTLYDGTTLGTSKIRVGVATTGTSYAPNGWGAAITSMKWRRTTAEQWSDDLIKAWNSGYELQFAGHDLPLSQLFYAAAHYVPCDPDPDLLTWNPTQAGSPDPYVTPDPPSCPIVEHGASAWITGAGGTNHLHTRTLVPDFNMYVTRDFGIPDDWCMYLDQTVTAYERYVQIDYTLSKSPYACTRGGVHHISLQETPAVFAWTPQGSLRGGPDRLDDAWLYQGTSPWTGGALTYVPWQPEPNDPAQADWTEVFPTESWIGLFRTPAEGSYGLTIASPARTRHQPFMHLWSFYQHLYDNSMWSRAWFDFVPSAVPAQSVSWTVYAIPGLVDDNRVSVYNVLPHPTWGFNLSTPNMGYAHEGWATGYQVSTPLAQGGYLKTVTTGSDPQIYSLDQLDFAADEYSDLVVRMKVSAGTTAQVFYMTEEDATWDEGKSYTRYDVTPGVFGTYTFHLHTTAGWAGKTIKRLRLDPTTSAGTTVDVDYMYLVPNPPSWQFNAAGNHEGWAPMGSQWQSPVWPVKVQSGILELTSTGAVTDTVTDPDTISYPTIVSPYPISVPAPQPGGARYLQVRMRYTGTGTFNARLRYTLTTDSKQFDYHGGSETNPYHPLYSLITRFDEAEHAEVWQNGLAANQWVTAQFALPSTGVIDQFELVPTNKAGKVEIDWIVVNYV